MTTAYNKNSDIADKLCIIYFVSVLVNVIKCSTQFNHIQVGYMLKSISILLFLVFIWQFRMKQKSVTSPQKRAKPLQDKEPQNDSERKLLYNLLEIGAAPSVSYSNTTALNLTGLPQVLKTLFTFFTQARQSQAFTCILGYLFCRIFSQSPWSPEP